VNYTYTKYEAIDKSRKKKFIDHGKIFNDDKDELSQYHFLLDVLRNAYEFSKDHVAIYVCFATKQQLAFVTAFRDAGFLFSQTIIWLKERIILALGQDYHRVYEPILFGWKEGSVHYKDKTITTEKEVWDLDRMTFEERLDVWYISRDKSKDYIHPTQKPIRLAERAIRKNSKIGDLLFEPFNGSGSTMMACEKSERRCYAIEMDPKYVEVAIERWERATGKKAEKII
jgi:DNA modification methylase